MKRKNHQEPAFRFKKSFGQNFLTDQNIKKKILEHCNFRADDSVLEIGPGNGAMTEEIAKRVKELVAIEKDKTLIPLLKEKIKAKNVTLIHADFLTYPFEKLPKPLKVFGNLPYNIATAVIERILLNQQNCQELLITVQLEHGRRMTANPRTKDYGSFSCFVQYYCRPEILFKIKNTSFYPIPKVESCFMRATIDRTPRYRPKSEDFLFKVIRSAFQQRRKTIQNSLKQLSGKNSIETACERLSLRSQSRAEELSLEDFVRISDQLLDLKSEEGHP